MVAKIILGNNVNGLLQYLTKKKHAVLTSNKIFPDPDINYISNEFKTIQGLNNRVKKNVMHLVLAFDKDEKIDDYKMAMITEDFMKEFEADENQWISFQHFDTEHLHQHTVINRVKMDGTLLSDSYSKTRAINICRALEIRYKLKIVSNIKSENKNLAKQELKQIIDEAILKSNSIEEFKKKVETEKYKVYLGRGIAFVNTTNGAKFKGSDIGRNYSLMNIKKQLLHLSKDKLQSKSLKEEQKDIKNIISTTKTTSTNSTIKSLSSLAFDLLNDNSNPFDEYQEDLNKKKKLKRRR